MTQFLGGATREARRKDQAPELDGGGSTACLKGERLGEGAGTGPSSHVFVNYWISMAEDPAEGTG